MSLFALGVAFGTASSSAVAQTSAPRDLYSDTWVASDALGRAMPSAAQSGAPKANKTVGIFYFLWSDRATSTPYDISKILAANPQNPQWGGVSGFHFWGEPLFGYYLAPDPFVIRKHAQMLTDAGVDVIVCDTTNNQTYPGSYLAICQVYTQMRAQGLKTPQITFLASQDSMDTLWRDFYQKNLYSDLWFQWKGKPLIEIKPEVNLPTGAAEFFSVRRSWAWTYSNGWFGDGKSKWPWLDNSPQKPGLAPDGSIEQISVSMAQHPTSSIGRSYKSGRQPAVDQYHMTGTAGQGIYFDEQWTRARAVNPEFIFVTGWNEWIAQRSLATGSGTFAGLPQKEGDSFFVDALNQEFSRDAEPTKLPIGDNYYYQLAANIRRYKGAREVPAGRKAALRIDGNFSDWSAVTNEYRDTLGDPVKRDYAGWKGLRYTNSTGRNDIVSAKASYDGKFVYFYAQTQSALSSAVSDGNWMLLYIDADQNPGTGWMGYDFVVNKSGVSATTTTIAPNVGGRYEWGTPITIPQVAKGNEIEVAVPQAVFGTQKAPKLDFKWADNTFQSGTWSDFTLNGDAAPNDRFNYRVAAANETFYVWKGGDGNWNDTSKWLPTGYPHLPGDTATFNQGNGTISIPTAATDAMAETITLAATSGDYVIGASNGGTLNLNGLAAVEVGSGRTLSVASPVASSATLGKSGAGTLVLSGTNSLATTINFATGADSGAIRLASSGALGGVSTINSLGNNLSYGRIELANDISLGTGVTLNVAGKSSAADLGAILTSLSGNNTWAGAINMAATGGRYALVSNLGTLTLSGPLSSSVNIASRTYEIGGGGNIVVSGTIRDNGTNLLGLTKFGTGQVTLSGLNTYHAGTTVEGGLLSFNRIGNVGADSALGNPNSAANGTINLSNAVLLYTGPVASSDRAFNMASDGSIHNSGPGTLTLSGAITGTGIPAFGGSADIIHSGAISVSDKVRKSGTNTLSLSNASSSFPGSLDVLGGTLRVNSVASGGVNSAIGAGTILNLGQYGQSATLVFTGANGGSSNRTLNLPGNMGATIDQSGAAGLLKWSGTVSPPGGASGNYPKTLTLQGSTAATGEISGVISDSISASGQFATSLLKTGSGTWTLSGANTYRGTTTVSAGTLALGASNVIADMSNLSLGGTLRTNGNSDRMGMLSLTTDSTLDLGNAVSTLKWSGGGTFGGTLSVLNYSGSSSGGGTDQMFVGTNQNLTGTQLARIVFLNPTTPSGTTTGSFGAVQLPSGEVVPVLPSSAPSSAVISEFRFRGPGGSTDEFVEIHNTLATPLDISGWSIRTNSGTRTAPIFQTSVAPANSVIPALGHFLFTGSGYSLSEYGAGDANLSGDAAIDSGVALLDARSAIQDAVGFATSPASLREGAGLPSAPNADGQNAFMRDYAGSLLKNTSADSSQDFVFVSTDGASVAGTGGPIAAQLGAPSPAGLGSPVYINRQVGTLMLDTGASQFAYPNRDRIGSGDGGFLIVRRQIKNNSGRTLNRVRFNITRITGLGSKITQPTPQAELRLTASSDETITLSDGITKVAVGGTRLEFPSLASPGGGLGSSVSFIAELDTPLLPGESRNYSFQFDIKKAGYFFAWFNIEALSEALSQATSEEFPAVQ